MRGVEEVGEMGEWNFYISIQSGYVFCYIFSTQTTTCNCSARSRKGVEGKSGCSKNNCWIDKLVGKRKGNKKEDFVVCEYMWIHMYMHTGTIPNGLSLCEEKEFNQ